eukprot:m.259889 g.259889  ORF g.259889 m.259889 type:complete len:128 (-) comp15978_c0_seq2:453-836(-)
MHAMHECPHCSHRDTQAPPPLSRIHVLHGFFFFPFLYTETGLGVGVGVDWVLAAGVGWVQARTPSCHVCSVFSAPQPDLAAPECVLHVFGRRGPVVDLEVAHKRPKALERSKVEGHVGHDVLNVAAH